MNLQDDYFDLVRSLRGNNKAAFIRIWEAFCAMEAEYEKLCEIKQCFKKMVRLSFEDERSES